jgi:hypothetical protein
MHAFVIHTLERQKICPIEVYTFRKNESKNEDNQANQNNPSHMIFSSGAWSNILLSPYYLLNAWVAMK